MKKIILLVFTLSLFCSQITIAQSSAGTAKQCGDTLIVQLQVDSLQYGLFDGFTETDLKTVIINSSTPIVIDKCAFEDTPFKNVIFETEVQSIAPYAFIYSNIVSVSLPKFINLTPLSFAVSAVKDVYLTDRNCPMYDFDFRKNLVLFGDRCLGEYVYPNYGYDAAKVEKLAEECRISETEAKKMLDSIVNGYYDTKRITYHYGGNEWPSAYDSFSIVHLYNEPIGLEYNIKSNRPSTILSYLPLDKLDEIKSLTISGLLCADDMLLIREKCRRLEYLDLRNAIITNTPTIHQSEEKLLSFYNELLSVISKGASSITQSLEDSYIPGECFANMLELRELYLPITASTISNDAFYNCHQLTKLVLPPYLEECHSNFHNCGHIQSVEFPKTLKKINSTFSDCAELQNISFSGPVSQDSDFKVQDCPQMREIHVPEGIIFSQYAIERCNGMPIDVYYPSTLEKCSLSHMYNLNIHFKTSAVPRTSFANEGGGEGDCIITLCIPKGSLTAYYLVFGDDVRYVEE